MASRDQHVAEHIATAQDMLGRLGQRDAYEPNYAREKLCAAAKQAIEACALLGEDRDALHDMAWEAADRGHRMRLRLAGGSAEPRTSGGDRG